MEKMTRMEIAKFNDEKEFEAKKALILKEIKVNNEYMKIIELLKPVFMSYDGKTLNKRIETALKTKLREVEGDKWNCSFKKHNILNDRYEFSIYASCQNRSAIYVVYDKISYFTGELEKTYLKVQNDNFSYTLPTPELDLGDSKTCFNGLCMIEELEKMQEQLTQNNKALKETYNQIDNMLLEVKELEEKVKQYNNKYKSSRVKELFDCNIYLRKY